MPRARTRRGSSCGRSGVEFSPLRIQVHVCPVLLILLLLQVQDLARTRRIRVRKSTGRRSGAPCARRVCRQGGGWQRAPSWLPPHLNNVSDEVWKLLVELDLLVVLLDPLLGVVDLVREPVQLVLHRLDLIVNQPAFKKIAPASAICPQIGLGPCRKLAPAARVDLLGGCPQDVLPEGTHDVIIIHLIPHRRASSREDRCWEGWLGVLKAFENWQ